MIYLDNSATSWPKPPGVTEAMVRFMEDVGANPGRSGHRQSIQAGRIVNDLREELAALFGASDPLRIVFGLNATEAINLVLHGFLHEGDHVITTSMEHNAVMRPLRALEQAGVKVSVVACTREGFLDPAHVEAYIGPRTRLIVMNHASNVIGTLLPVPDVARIARSRGLLLLVDAATTAGCLPIDVARDGIDLLAFTGHKGLGGPTGTGGLVIGDRVDPRWITPLKQGGTGSRSADEVQPTFLPDSFESGTLNVVGLAGLLAAVRWIRARGIGRLRAEQIAMVGNCLHRLSDIAGIAVYGSTNAAERLSAISLNIAGMLPSEVGLRLDEEYRVLARVGLHCAPAAHRTMGTAPGGTVRIAPGAFTSAEDIDAAIAAISALAAEARAKSAPSPPGVPQ